MRVAIQSKISHWVVFEVPGAEDMTHDELTEAFDSGNYSTISIERPSIKEIIEIAVTDTIEWEPSSVFFRNTSKEEKEAMESGNPIIRE